LELAVRGSLEELLELGAITGFTRLAIDEQADFAVLRQGVAPELG
jgi:hypothetical protein